MREPKTKKGDLASRIKAEESRPRELKRNTREDTVRLSVPLDPEFHATIKATAAMNRMTMEAATVEALEAWLEQKRK